MTKKREKSDFSKQDCIFCVGGTHTGLTARVTSVGGSRLTVQFELPSYEGYFVEKTNAIVVSEDFDPVKSINPRQDIPFARATAAPFDGRNIKNKATKFYAVARGRTPDIYHTWDECETQIKGYSNGCYKRFNSLDKATEFIELYCWDTTQESETLLATHEKLRDTEALLSLPQHLALASVDAINKIATTDQEAYKLKIGFFSILNHELD